MHRRADGLLKKPLRIGRVTGAETGGVWRQKIAHIGALQDIHRKCVFPAMNIQWNTYNSLIGHATPHTGACFRCHNGILRDEEGQPMTVDCQSCHYVLADREIDPRILDRLLQE